MHILLTLMFDLILENFTLDHNFPRKGFDISQENFFWQDFSFGTKFSI
jgi:hypothetical protein